MKWQSPKLVKWQSPKKLHEAVWAMWDDLVRAVCLLLIFEGILPFVSPGRWRSAVMGLARVSNVQLRLAGFLSMLAGAGLLYFLR